MSEHITEWLNAYQDGVLLGTRLQHVEAHLAECQACQAELESLESLSALLHDVPLPEFTPPERFASQVNLFLPAKQMTTPRKRMLEIGWWMIPVGLLGAWIFASAAFLAGDIWSAAADLGLVPGISDMLVFSPWSQTYWSATLGQFGILSGESLHWAVSTEAFTRASLPQIMVQVSIALLYLSWIAIWWVRQQRREQGRLLEG